MCKTDMHIFYSCLKCKKRFDHMNDMENHLEKEHGLFNPEELDRNYLIHFPEEAEY